MKSTQVIVTAAVVIVVSVICGIEGIPRPQEPGKDYVEVDGFVFDGPVDRTRSSSTRRPPIVVPTFTPPNSIPTFTPPNTVPTFTPPLVTPSSAPPTGSPTTEAPAVTQCIQNCRFRVTSEYNPVCGTDGIVYNNPGTLSCAISCGRSVSEFHLGPCRSVVRG